MDAPSSILLSAAKALREAARAATAGPWSRPLNTRHKSHVNAALPPDETGSGSYRDGIDPTTGARERCTVVTVPIWSNGKHLRKRGGRDLEYIALMAPDVGGALAVLLERVGRATSEIEEGLGVDFHDGSLDQATHDALGIARKILGLAEPEVGCERCGSTTHSWRRCEAYVKEVADGEGKQS